MNASRIRWAAALLAVLVVAALVATGCGKKGAKAGAGKAAVSAKALDYVPASSLLYMVIDTDFDGKNWKRAEKHAKKFDGYEEGKQDALDSMFEDSDLTYDKDIKPWLGESAGVAVLSAGTDDEVEVVAWADVTDDAKAEKFLKKETDEKGTSKHEGYTIHEAESDSDTTYWTIKDKVLLFSDSEGNVKKAIDAKEDGKGVLKSDDVKDVAGEVGENTLAAIVVTGDGVRDIVDEAETKSEDAAGVSGISELEQVKALKGMSIGIEVTDDGVRMHGFAGYDKEKLGKKGLPHNFKPTLMQDLPADTMFAATFDDLGGMFGDLIETVTKDDEEMQANLSQLEAGLDIKIDDVSEAFSGQTALGVMPGSGPLPAVGMISEAADEDAVRETLDKLMGATAMSTGAAPKDATFGEVEAKQASFGMTSLIAAVFGGNSVLTNDGAFIEALSGDDTLGESDTFADAWKESGAPDEVGGALFVDTQELLKLAAAFGQDAGSEAEAFGPMVGWIDNGEDSQSFDLYVRIEEGSGSDSDDA